MLRRTIFKLSQTVVASVQNDVVGVLKLNRPESLNALNGELVRTLAQKVREFEADDSICSMVITGEGDKAFAAGADIKEMSAMNYSDVYLGELFGDLIAIRQAKKPIIAAVNGFALGGGCELAMLCDIIYASEKAKFGQPEIKLGTIPGIGGTQNLTKLIGKGKAMEWVLTGRIYSADEAEKAGLVARVFPAETLLSESVKTATEIASYSRLTTAIAKDAVNKSLDLGITYDTFKILFCHKSETKTKQKQ